MNDSMTGVGEQQAFDLVHFEDPDAGPRLFIRLKNVTKISLGETKLSLSRREDPSFLGVAGWSTQPQLMAPLSMGSREGDLYFEIDDGLLFEVQAYSSLAVEINEEEFVGVLRWDAKELESDFTIDEDVALDQVTVDKIDLPQTGASGLNGGTIKGPDIGEIEKEEEPEAEINNENQFVKKLLVILLILLLLALVAFALYSVFGNKRGADALPGSDTTTQDEVEPEETKVDEVEPEKFKPEEVMPAEVAPEGVTPEEITLKIPEPEESTDLLEQFKAAIDADDFVTAKDRLKRLTAASDAEAAMIAAELAGGPDFKPGLFDERDDYISLDYYRMACNEGSADAAAKLDGFRQALIDEGARDGGLSSTADSLVYETLPAEIGRCAK